LRWKWADEEERDLPEMQAVYRGFAGASQDFSSKYGRHGLLVFQSKNQNKCPIIIH